MQSATLCHMERLDCDCVSARLPKCPGTVQFDAAHANAHFILKCTNYSSSQLGSQDWIPSRSQSTNMALPSPQSSSDQSYTLSPSLQRVTLPYIALPCLTLPYLASPG